MQFLFSRLSREVYIGIVMPPILRRASISDISSSISLQRLKQAVTHRRSILLQVISLTTFHLLPSLKMCLCSQPLEYEYETRGSARTVPVLEKSYDRHAHPSYASTGRAKRPVIHMSGADSYARDGGYGTMRPPTSLRRDTRTPPPVLIQSTPMGRTEAPQGQNTASGRRFGRVGSLDSTNSSVRSGEMGFNQPMVLQDGLGPVIHQGHSAHYQTSHHTGHPPHIHTNGPRSAIPRRYSINTNNDRGRVGSRYIGYREGSGSSSGEESWGSERRLFTKDVRGSYGGRSSAESFYHSSPSRRFS